MSFAKSVFSSLSTVQKIIRENQKRDENKAPNSLLLPTELYPWNKKKVMEVKSTLKKLAVEMNNRKHP